MLTIRVQPCGSEPPTYHEVPGGPFDIGRGLAVDGVPRCVVLSDLSVSRNHARITEQSDGRVGVLNLSKRMEITFDGKALAPGESRLFVLPAKIMVGDTVVEIDRPADDEHVALQTMASLASSPLLRSRPGRLAATSEVDYDPAVVAGWFESLIAVQMAPAGSVEFYTQTARALVEQIGMDIGMVLLNQPGGWSVAARYPFEVTGVREFSLTVLVHVACEKRTIYHAEDLPSTKSLAKVKSLIASPVFSSGGDVAGVLYGIRRTPRNRGFSISALEAQMVQVLATAVGVGLARVAQEVETARLRVQLQQQFNDRLARELETNLARLDPQDREITILFADIRGFSRISERLGPAETFQFVSDVMEALTESVKRHDGAIMDYVGDELIALWNAPADQTDHARLAFECAIALAGDLSSLHSRWQPRLGEEVQVGIGVNTGLARVGNTGTRSKPKYGALGHTVNVASRVQGATKAFQCAVLLTESTRKGLPGSLPLRRIGKVKVLGIQEAVDLFQPRPESNAVPPDVLQKYAEALDQFESGKLDAATTSLAALLTMTGAASDGATMALAAKLKLIHSAGGENYEPVLELGGK